jgi:hypothetical protein
MVLVPAVVVRWSVGWRSGPSITKSVWIGAMMGRDEMHAFVDYQYADVRCCAGPMYRVPVLNCAATGLHSAG